MIARDVVILAAVAGVHALLFWPAKRTAVAFAPRARFVEMASVPRAPSLPKRAAPGMASTAAEPVAVAPVAEAAVPGPSGDVTAAELVRWGNAPPVYPESSRQAGEEGTVVVVVNVDGEGRSVDARVSESSGHSALDGAVLEAAKSWKFPEGKGSAFRVRVEFALQ